MSGKGVLVSFPSDLVLVRNVTVCPVIRKVPFRNVSNLLCKGWRFATVLLTAADSATIHLNLFYMPIYYLDPLAS